MKHLLPGKISSRLRVKRGCEDNVITNIPSTKGTRGNVKKVVELLVLLGVLEVANHS